MPLLMLCDLNSLLCGGAIDFVLLELRNDSQMTVL